MTIPPFLNRAGRTAAVATAMMLAAPAAAGPAAAAPDGGQVAVAPRSYAEDRAEIENLMSAYMLAFDTLDARALADTLAADGTLTLTGNGFPPVTFTGPSGLATFVAAIAARNRIAPATQHPSFSPNVHFFTNLVLRVDGDRATATSYWFTVRRGANHDVVGEADAGTSKFVSQGYYQDEFARFAGRWLITHRTVKEMQPAQGG